MREDEHLRGLVKHAAPPKLDPGSGFCLLRLNVASFSHGCRAPQRIFRHAGGDAR